MSASVEFGVRLQGVSTIRSHIDYTTAASNYDYFSEFESELPGLDAHGLLVGEPDGASVRFEPTNPECP